MGYENDDTKDTGNIVVEVIIVRFLIFDINKNETPAPKTFEFVRSISEIDIMTNLE